MPKVISATKTDYEHRAMRATYLSDLPSDKQVGDEVMSVDLNQLPSTVWAAMADVFRAAEYDGMSQRPSYKGRTLYLALTAEQIAERIAFHNSEWDRSADRYDVCLTDGKPADYYVRNDVQRYCAKRGIDLPWSEDED